MRLAVQLCADGDGGGGRTAGSEALRVHVEPARRAVVAAVGSGRSAHIARPFCSPPTVVGLERERVRVVDAAVLLAERVAVRIIVGSRQVPPSPRLDETSHA